MPVPTETFWNIRRLNLVFLGCAALLALSTVLFVVRDYHRAWRGYQRDANTWGVAMTQDAMQTAFSLEVKIRLDELAEERASLAAAAPVAEIARIEKDVADAEYDRDRLSLRLAVQRGQVGPLNQQVERAVLTYGADSSQVRRLRNDLDAVRQVVDQMDSEMATLNERVTTGNRQLRELRQATIEVERRRGEIEREQAQLEEQLAKLKPTGLAKLTHVVRNAPLMDWFNPSEKVAQVVVPDVHTDLNFMRVETMDRCMTCHVNIDKPAYEETQLLAFVERQIAQSDGQNVNALGHVQPVVLLDFWTNVVRGQPSLEAPAGRVHAASLARLNAMRQEIGRSEITSDQLIPELLRIGREESGDDRYSRSDWYAQLRYYVDELRVVIERELGARDYKNLRDLYRTVAIDAYNVRRRDQGMPALSSDPVLMGHPRIELFAGTDSSHPMSQIGCTVCHEGAGQETDFIHAVHTPREIWVDAKTGTPVPAFLVRGVGTQRDIKTLMTRTPGPVADADATLADMIFAYARDDQSGTSGGSAVRSSHQDVKLTDIHNPNPFAPSDILKGESAAYQHPGDEAGVLRMAVRQEAYWTKKYSWHEVHYMHWEKPMHRLDYIESSCMKCHDEIYDLRESAPQLFTGRKLFAQLGCVNCHAVEALEGDLDIKQVGPSLVHAMHKLTPDMMASWIWSPRSFRPTSRMPHYFMLENNSSPVDILRTRVEVAAMTYHLQTTAPSEGTPAYSPEAAPEQPGDVALGKELFTAIGCLACHTNLNEFGEQWIVQDLKDRQGLDTEAATAAYAAMDYNHQHWYAMEHLRDKVELAGPELSGVGTKLIGLAPAPAEGEDPHAEIRAQRYEAARRWLFDWIRNPRHYSSYTTMPSFRLTEEEANHITAYLLTMERPGYQPENFFDLDDQARTMLRKLVTSLKSGQLTFEQTEKRIIEEGMSVEDQLAFLGGRMITHYGCNGCHVINGFEDAPSACVNLDEWGLKDPHLVDFGYFGGAYKKQRATPAPVYKVAHEGLAANAPQIGVKDAAGDPSIELVRLSWDDIRYQDRRSWLYNKLHNPRVYDRGKTSIEGRIDGEEVHIGRPYDKLKMPKFFVTDDQARALVTYVTGIRKPLVSDSLLQATYTQDQRLAAQGRKLATLFNCYACHAIDGNEVHIHEFFGVHNADGSLNANNVNWAPPRLWGQGAKTQPDWLHHFLQNVKPIRPWLKVRMPSFHLDSTDATNLVGFFAGSTMDMKRQIKSLLETIDPVASANPESRWYDAASIANAVSKLEAFAVHADLASRASLSPRGNEPEMRHQAWTEVLAKSRILAGTYHTEYPYIQKYIPEASIEDIIRGERLFVQMGCMTGECHRMGDEDILRNAGLLIATAPPAEEDPYGDGDGYGEDEADESAVFSIAPKTPPAGAPNLSLIHERLQRDWFAIWLKHATKLAPGTRMQEFWPNDQSFFAVFPPDMKEQSESLFGYTAEQQKNLLLKFLYAASRRGITYNVDGTRLGPGEAPTVDLSALKPIDRPADAPAPDPSAPRAPTMATPTTTPGSPAAAASDEANAAIFLEDEKSKVEWQDAETASFSGTRLVGQVITEARARRRPVRMAADPYCDRFHRSINHSPLEQAMIIGDEGEFRNVMIYVKSGLPDNMKVSAEAAAALPPVVIDQIGCEYLPRVSGAVVGQPVRILNSDATLHNVRMASRLNGSFNDGMPVKGMVLNKTFNRAEFDLTLRCDVHAWMAGFVHVFDHPFFAVSDAKGRWEIKGLPPGRYVLEARHESSRVQPVTFEVEVKADTSHRVDVSFTR